MTEESNEQIAALQKQVEALTHAVQRMSKHRDNDSEQFMEPQSFLTRFMAKWSPRVDERTRILSYEELDWMDSDMLLAAVLGVPVYGIEATTHLRLLISKDGESRREAVEGMQALNFAPKGHYSGLEQASGAIETQRPRK